VLYPCDLLTCRQLAQIVKENLRPIGIEVDVEQFPIPALLAKLARGDEPYDIAVYGYRADVADPAPSSRSCLPCPYST
jgi:ABC-type transport system substrate-binding protein